MPPVAISTETLTLPYLAYRFLPPRWEGSVQIPAYKRHFTSTVY
jgi:hypothetical protein